MGGTPGEQGWKMEIYHPPGCTAQGTNISHPTLLPAERPCLVCPEGQGLAVGDKSGSKPARSLSWGWEEPYGFQPGFADPSAALTLSSALPSRGFVKGSLTS